MCLLYSGICFCHIQNILGKDFSPTPSAKDQTGNRWYTQNRMSPEGFIHRGLFTKVCGGHKGTCIQICLDNPKPDLLPQYHSQCDISNISILNKDLCELLHYNQVPLVWEIMLLASAMVSFQNDVCALKSARIFVVIMVTRPHHF